MNIENVNGDVTIFNSPGPAAAPTNPPRQVPRDTSVFDRLRWTLSPKVVVEVLLLKHPEDTIASTYTVDIDSRVMRRWFKRSDWKKIIEHAYEIPNSISSPFPAVTPVINSMETLILAAQQYTLQLGSCMSIDDWMLANLINLYLHPTNPRIRCRC